MKPVLFRVTNNLNIGGITSRMRLVLPLLTDFFEVHVVTYKNEGILGGELRDKGIHVHHVPIKGKWNPSDIRTLAGLFKKYRASVVHTHSFGGNISGILAAALAGVPVRFGQVHARMRHWYGKTAWRRTKQRYEEFFVHRLFSDAVIFPSALSREYFAAHCKLPSSMLRLIPNGIDLSYAQSGKPDFILRELFDIPEEKKIIGYVGRLDAPKGIYFAFDFMRRLFESTDDYVLVVVGGAAGDKEEERIRRQFAALGEGRVFFAGMRDDVQNFYLGFDALFFPSEPQGEALPGVVLEAAAYGLPVLSRQNEAVKALAPLYGRIGFMDDGALPQRALTDLFSMPPVSVEGIWQTYGITSMVRETVSLYNEFLCKKGLPGVPAPGRKKL